MKNIKFGRIFIFFMSVIALSKFFESGRLISSEMSFAHMSTSVISLILFVLSLLILGYWVYEEEKQKNNLKVKFNLYEWIYKKRMGGPAKGRWGEEK